MNVQETLLRERVDPKLTDQALTKVAERAVDVDSYARGTENHRLADGGLADEAPHRGGDSPRTGTGRGVSGYRVLTGGCWNRVIGVRTGQTDLVYKISPHPQDEKIVREFAVLLAFAEHSDLPVPRPLYLDRGDLLPGTTLVMTRLPGTVMHQCFGLLGSRDRARITERIAEDLATLHHNTSRGFGGVEVPDDERYPHWPDFWLPRLDRVLKEADESGVVPRDLIEGAKEIRSDLRSALEIGPESTMTHYDIWSGNVMIDVDSQPARVSGYIDIPGFYADYARELSFAMLFGVADRRFFATYLRHHTLDSGFELRVNAYNLKMNIRHIQMYPSEMFYRSGAEENLAFLRRAL